MARFYLTRRQLKKNFKGRNQRYKFLRNVVQFLANNRLKIQIKIELFKHKFSIANMTFDMDLINNLKSGI